MNKITSERVDLTHLTNQHEAFLLDFIYPYFEKIKNIPADFFKEDILSISIERNKNQIASWVDYQSVRSGQYKIALTSKKGFFSQPSLSLSFTNTIKSHDPDENTVVLKVRPETFPTIAYFCVVRLFMHYVREVYPERKMNAKDTHHWLIRELSKKALRQHGTSQERLKETFTWALSIGDKEFMEYLCTSTELSEHVSISEYPDFLRWCECNDEMKFYFTMKNKDAPSPSFSNLSPSF